MPNAESLRDSQGHFAIAVADLVVSIVCTADSSILFYLFPALDKPNQLHFGVPFSFEVDILLAVNDEDSYCG